MRRFFQFSVVSIALLFPVAAWASPLSETNFITELYEDVLNRAPSPSELTADLAVLGSITHQQLASQILSSAEYDEGLVRGYSQSYIGANPTTVELAAEVAILKISNDQTVQAGILGSAAFFNDHGATNAGFVDGLFLTLLGTNPTASQQTFFETQLAGSFTRTQVAAELLASSQYNQDLLTGYFEQYLDRSPTSTEDGAFLPLLEAGGNDEAVQADILGSVEYSDQAQRESATPEPSSLLLLGTGLLGLGPLVRRFAHS